MNILDLPEEILALIIQQLPSYRDHFALAGTCHHLHDRVFSHVRELSFKHQPLELFQRTISYYTELRCLVLIGIIPSPESLRHLTSVQAFACLMTYSSFSHKPLEDAMSLNIRLAYADLLPWILKQPLEWITMSWWAFSLEDRLKIFSLPTLQRLQNIDSHELSSVSSSIEKLSVNIASGPANAESIQFSHLIRLRKLSINVREMTPIIIDELVKLPALYRLNLTISRLSCVSELAVLPVHALTLNQYRFRDDLSCLVKWKYLSRLNLFAMNTLTAEQVKSLLSHPSKDRLYIRLQGWQYPQLLTEIHHKIDLKLNTFNSI